MDAFDLVWCRMVMQVALEDLFKSHINKPHQPLPFLSDFSGPQLECSTLKKEAFAIISSVDQIHLTLAMTDGFGLFTDLHKVIVLFDHLVVVPDLSQK